MAVVRPYHRYRGESSFTMPSLVAAVGELLPRIAPEQTRYRVTTIPTERTIRYYTGLGLVDKPLGRKGQAALYGYRHLLQVLAVKCLQSQYLPLRKVRALVAGAGNRDLEQVLPDVAASGRPHFALAREGRAVAVAGAPATPTGTPPAAAADEPAAASPALDAWHRLEIGPGVELHVHAAALAAGERERLRGALLRELGVLRGWFPSGAGKD